MTPRPSALALHAALALPLAFGGLPIYLHAPDLYVTEYGASLGALGVALLLLRTFDAVQDPVIGWLCDRWHRHRAVIAMAGLAMMVAGFWALFNPAGPPLAWFAGSVLLCTTGFSVASIAYQAAGGLWAVSSDARTRVTGWREAFGLAGLLLASILPTVLAGSQGQAEAFRTLVFVFAALALLGGVLFMRWMARTPLRMPAREGARAAMPDFRTWLSDPPLRRFLGIFLISSIASAIPGVLIIFYVRDRLGAEAQTGVFLLLYFVSGAASMVLWQWAARRWGKARAWLTSMLVAVATFVWAFTLGAGDAAAFMAVCILSGTALGADLALPPAILADRIEAREDEASAARYFAATNFLSKAALALASGLTLPALALAGYQPGAVTPGAPETAALAVTYALLPCVIKAMAALWLWRSDVGDLRAPA